MQKKDIKKTVFACPEDLFGFLCMPFELKNVGAMLQWVLDFLIMGLSWEEVHMYLNDLIMFVPHFVAFLEVQAK